MAENTQLAEQPKRQVGPVQQVKLLLNEDTVKKRFTDVLGKKAPQFMASIVNVVSASPQLKQCDANSIMAASFVAASFDLPIDSNLGFAALVPYKKSFKDKETGQWVKKDLAQFQMMYKGFVQLAIRTGQYVQTNIMLAIRLEDAMAVCAAAADASRKAEGCTETKEDAGVAEPKSDL